MSPVKKKLIVRSAIAIRHNLPKPFYVFSLRSAKLKEIAYVSERTKENPQDGIERNLVQSRCKKIGKYIQSENAIFPNSIIVALHKPARFIPSRQTNIGKISIPSKPSQALILDGQHRLYGFDYAQGKELDLLVAAFIDIPIKLKAHIFRMINGEQKRVNSSLVYDLLDLDDSTANFIDMRAHELVKELDQDEYSPFYQCIQMTGKRKEGFISQASLISYLKPHLRKYGILRKDEYSSFNRQFKLISDYFTALSHSFPDDWLNSSSVLSKTTGINAFLRLFGDMVPMVEIADEQPTYRSFMKLFGRIRDFPMDIATHKKYGIGGAIALYKELVEYFE